MGFLERLNEVVKAANQSIHNFQIKMMQKKIERQFIKEEAEKSIEK